MSARSKKTAARKAKKPRATQKPVTPNRIDPEIIRRREITVSRLIADGETLVEIADALLRTHMNGGDPLFTFFGPDNKALAPDALTMEEMRQRVYNTVRQDLHNFRERVSGRYNAKSKLAEDRFVLETRLREMFKDANTKRKAEQDTVKFTIVTKECRELATRLGRLQGVETEKAIELKLPERYVVRIDDDGIIHKQKVTEEQQEEGEPN